MGLRGLASIIVLLLAACGGEPGGAGTAPGGSGGSDLGGPGGEGGTDQPGGIGGTVDPDAPRIEALVPATGPVGQLVELRGVNLQASRELAVIFRPGVSSPPLAADHDGTWIRTYVPAGATSGPVNLRLDGENYEGPSFAVNTDLPAPRLDRLDPDYVMAGALATGVRLEGWGFCASSRVLVDDRELETSSIAIDALEVVLPEALLQAPGSHTFRVENPAPGGGSTATLPFRVSGPFNLLAATPLDSTTVRLDFDRPPSRQDAAIVLNYHFECYT